MLKKVHFPFPFINESLYLKRGLWLPWASELCWGCVGRRNRGRGEKISFMMGWRWAVYISFLGKSCNLPVLLIIIFYYRYKLKIYCVSHSQQGLKLFSNYYLWINLASISSACWGIIEVCVCVCLLGLWRRQLLPFDVPNCLFQGSHFTFSFLFAKKSWKAEELKGIQHKNPHSHFTILKIFI